MKPAENILLTAAREIGVQEGKGKHTKYGEFTGYDGQPWCMSFVQWVYHEAGSDLPVMTASCGELLRWYQRNDPDCITREPVPGCIVIFDWPNTAYDTDHTGLFVSRTATTVTTIDGNTSGLSDSNGGFVQQKTRRLSYANPIYIIPRELEETDMEKRYNTIKEISDGAPWATETVAKLIERGAIRGAGVKDEQGRPADMALTEDMLRLLVISDRAGAYGV